MELSLAHKMSMLSFVWWKLSCHCHSLTSVYGLVHMHGGEILRLYKRNGNGTLPSLQAGFVLMVKIEQLLPLAHKLSLLMGCSYDREM